MTSLRMQSPPISSCKLSFLFTPRRQRAPESLLAGYIAENLTQLILTVVIVSASEYRKFSAKQIWNSIQWHRNDFQ